MNFELGYPLISLLERSREGVENLIDDFKDVFFIIDELGTILRCNLIGASLFGRPIEEVKGLCISSLFSPSTWEKFERHVQQFISVSKEVEGVEFSKEVEFELHVDGMHGATKAVFWTLKSISVTSPRYGNLFSLIGRDISVALLLEENNRKLEYQNGRVQAILDSALQGFITYDRNLIIENDYSQKAVEFFGQSLEGKNVCDVLNLNRNSIREFSDVVFQGQNWDLLSNFSKMETQVGGKTFKIELAPILEEGKVKRILAAITDVTELTLLQRRTEENSRLNRCVVKILQSKALFLDILRSVNDLNPEQSDTAEISRTIHTWKGEFSFFECVEFSAICHKWESKLAVKSDVENIRAFLTELRNAINQFLDRNDEVLKVREANSNEIVVGLDHIQGLVKQLRDVEGSSKWICLIEQIFEVPFSKAVGWLDGVWRSACERLGKEVNPIVWEESVPIFSQAYKRLLASLVHAVRNSADHGIEYAEERVHAGKPRRGTLRAKLELNDDMYLLKLKDDGRGIDLLKVKEVAEKKGIKIFSTSQNSEETRDADALDVLFEESFSSSDVVSEFSGRGLGLGAIRSEARLLGGDAHMKNFPGAGVELQVSFRKRSLLEIFSRES